LKNIKIAPDLSGITVAYSDSDINVPMISKPKYDKYNLIDLTNLPREYVGTIAFPNINPTGPGTIRYIKQDSIQNILDKISHQL